MLIGAATVADMTPAQRGIYDAIAQGPRNGVPFPFLAMLDSPHLAQAIQAVGAAIRFTGELSTALREVATLATAAAFGSGYEWDYHLKIARDAGVPEATIAMAASGEEDAAVDTASSAIIALCRGAVLSRRIDRATLERLVSEIGRAAASEVVAISGYYQMLALFLSAGMLDHEVDWPGQSRDPIDPAAIRAHP